MTSENRGRFKPGNPGRRKGSKNKVTTSLRKWILKFVHDERKSIMQDWGQLSPKQRLLLWEKLLQYCLPRFQSTNLNLSSMSDEELELLAAHIREQQNQQD